VFADTPQVDACEASLLAVIAWLACVGSHAQQTTKPDLRGIYVYTNAVNQLTKAGTDGLTAAVNLPGDDGIALVIGWNGLVARPVSVGAARSVDGARDLARQEDRPGDSGRNVRAWVAVSGGSRRRGRHAAELYDFTTRGRHGCVPVRNHRAPMGSDIPQPMGHSARGSGGTPEERGNLSGRYTASSHRDQSHHGGTEAARPRRRNPPDSHV
jgi:hypothetical protein